MRDRIADEYSTTDPRGGTYIYIMREVRALIAAAATVVCLTGPGIAHAFLQPHFSTHSAVGASAARQRQQQKQQYPQQGSAAGRLHSSSGGQGPTKPSLKPSWKSPRPTAPSSARDYSLEKAAELKFASTATAPPVSPGNERNDNSDSRNSKTFDKPTWKSPRNAKTVDDNTMADKSAATTSVLESTEPIVQDTSMPPIPQPIRTSGSPDARTSSNDPPAAVPFSPVLDDVAVTLRQAQEALLPFQKKVQDNIAEGNFGERGEEWVLAQAAIIVCIVLGTIPVVGGAMMMVAGPGLVAGGIAVGAAALSGLGKSLSPWPAPVDDNELMTSGIYGTIRHPMYSGESGGVGGLDGGKARAVVWLFGLI